ncbi:MAG TPA: L,D-transpeptidase [Gemmatimonadaceae bacterium]
MSSIPMYRLLATFGTAAALIGASSANALAQGPSDYASRTRTTSAADTTETESTYTFTSRSDSLSWARNRGVAEHSKGFRLVVSLQDRHLWAIVGQDTVLSAPVAVAKGTTLEFGNTEWKFITPRGIRTVLGKEADPIWQPPEWLYAETAKEYGLKLAHLSYGSPIKLADGRLLTIKDGKAGVIDDGEFQDLPTDEHIVFDNTLFVPPLGTENRKVNGELGKYRLILGDGYLLHGTPDKESIGMAATHGCVRLRDEDIEWLYDHVPVGTKVYIY